MKRPLPEPPACEHCGAAMGCDCGQRSLLEHCAVCGRELHSFHDLVSMAESALDRLNRTGSALTASRTLKLLVAEFPCREGRCTRDA